MRGAVMSFKPEHYLWTDYTVYSNPSRSWSNPVQVPRGLSCHLVHLDRKSIPEKPSGAPRHKTKIKAKDLTLLS